MAWMSPLFHLDRKPRPWEMLPMAHSMTARALLAGATFRDGCLDVGALFTGPSLIA